jgi:hypothetical protein
MLAFLATAAHKVGVECDAGHPGEFATGKDQRPIVSLLAGHARVYKHVLQFARSATACRPQPEAWTAMPEMERQTRSNMRGLRVVAPMAARDLQLETRPPRLTNDLHEATHNTETQAPWEIDTASTSAGLGQSAHRFDVRPRETRLWPARSRVEQFQCFDSYGFRHFIETQSRERSQLQSCSGLISRGLVPARGVQSHRMETPRDARPVSLECGQDVQPCIDPREVGVGVRRILINDDAASPQKLDHLASPNAKQRTHVMTARGGHAADARESASAQEVEDDTFDEVVGGVCDRDHLRACLAARAIEE